MSAIVRSCNVATDIKNTGVDSDVLLSAIVMVLLCPKTFSFDDADLEDPVLFFNDAVHASKANRIYPVFGNVAPVRQIESNKESDVQVTFDDGSTKFIRYGYFNIVLSTTDGGMCLAKALQSFVGVGYSVILIDNLGRMMVRENNITDDYAGLLTSFLSSPSPDLADFKNPWKTKLGISISPQEMVGRGVILSGADQLMDLMGLKDATLSIGDAGASTTTVLKFNAIVDCCRSNIAEITPEIATVDNFVVTELLTGTPVTITSAAIVETHIELTGTFVSGQTYVVTAVAPADLLANAVENIEIIGTLEITIP